MKTPRHRLSSISARTISAAFLAAALVLCSGRAAAQAHPWAEWGLLWASAFDAWSLQSWTPVPGPGLYTLQFAISHPPTIAGGPTFQPLQAGVPFLFGSGSNAEVAVPSAANCSESATVCAVTVRLSRAHGSPLLIRSGSAGLQEALNYARQHGLDTVVLDSQWTGTAAMVAASTGATTIQIEDRRQGQLTWYDWNGSQYVPALVLAGPRAAVTAGSMQIAQPPLTPSSIAGVVIPQVTPDGQANAHGHAVADSTSFSTTDSVFSSADVGKTIVIENAGTGGKGFVSTIAAYVSPTTITLAAAPSTSVAAGETLFFWGSDDTAPLQSALAEVQSAGHSKLQLMPGIYITTQPLVIQGASGLVITGAGNGGLDQEDYGTRIVYAGTAGGAPGSGTENATLRVSGSNMAIRDLALDGGGLATAALWVDLSSDNTFFVSVKNVGAYAAAFWSAVWGQPNGSAFSGHSGINASIDGLNWGASGCGNAQANCTGAALTDGGGNLINFGNGNYNFTMSNSAGLWDDATRRFGGRSLLVYSGNDFVFDNLYLPPLAESNVPSVDTEGGNDFHFRAIYDENGYGLLDTAGEPFDINGWEVRSTSGDNTNPHQAMLISSTGRITLAHVRTDQLPVVMATGASVTCQGSCVNGEAIGSDTLWGLTATVSAVQRSGGTATLTTSAQAFDVGDWISVSGLTNTPYNGTWRVTAVTATSLSFALSGTQSLTSDSGAVTVTPGLVGPNTYAAVGDGGPFYDASVLANPGGSAQSIVQQIFANPVAASGIPYIPPGAAVGGTNGQYFPALLPPGSNLLDLRPVGGQSAPFFYLSGRGGAIGTWEIGGSGIQPSSFDGSPTLEVQSGAGPDPTVAQFECSSAGSTCHMNFNSVDLSATDPIAQVAWSNNSATPDWSFSLAGQTLLDASGNSSAPILRLGSAAGANQVFGTALDVHQSGLLTTAQQSLVEGPAPAPTAGHDLLWADASTHRLEISLNGASPLLLPGLTAAGVAGDQLQIAANGTDLVDAGLPAGDATRLNGGNIPAAASVLGTDASGHLVAQQQVSAASFATTINCASASSPAACSSAAAGAVAVAPGATSVIVNTTAVTAQSEILLTFDASLTTRLGVSCNSTPVQPVVSSRTPAAGFTLSVATAPLSSPACFAFWIVN